MCILYQSGAVLTSDLPIGVQQHVVLTAGLLQPVWSSFLAAKRNDQHLNRVFLQGPLKHNVTHQRHSWREFGADLSDNQINLFALR